MLEVWKDIPGYEGLYQVSNLGRVKGLENEFYIVGFGFKKFEERILKLNKTTDGYHRVTLCKNKEREYCRVHRLVAEAFIDNPENKPFIDHINTIRTDNRVENLRWVTRRENNNNPCTKVKMKNSAKQTYKKREIQPYEKQEKPVLCVETGFIYKSLSEAARQTSIPIAGISKACLGQLKTSHGYHWKFINDIS